MHGFSLGKYRLHKDGLDQNDAQLDELIQSNRTLGVMACSKGCISRCTFCHRFIKGIRFVPVELCISRIKELSQRFDLGLVSFMDECVGACKKWLREFCATIKPLNVIWGVGGMRVDMVDPEIIKNDAEGHGREPVDNSVKMSNRYN
jgi:radical SAM superfamily enzyme YgiQ (UPF0313 family)|tara:strand:- start:3153 stop:3593 length:441 start_codon:yes stop_codon:yes gene_type:complete